MNSIGNAQPSNNSNQQQPAPVAQQPVGQQKTAFSGSTVPQQVSPLLQQLVQSSKDAKAPEHAEHLMDYGLDTDEDFQSEFIENTEVMTEEESLDAGQRDGQQEQSQQEEQAEAFEIPQLGSVLPVAVSGGGITVGLPPTSNEVKAVPVSDQRIIAIYSQNYSVAFLKRQVGTFANSSFANAAQDPDGVSLAHVPVSTPWGGAILAGSASQFESYIKATFPGGDPSVPANPAVRYEGGNLLVHGQAYGVNLTDPKLAGSVDSFLISYSPTQQAEVQRVLHDFSELQIINEMKREAGDSSYMVRVPADYYAQWQTALTDSLPAGTGIKFPVIPYGGGFI